MLKKLFIGFAQILVDVLKIHLFDSYLRFKNLYKIASKSLKYPLNFKIKVFKILKMKKATSEIKQIVKNWKKKRRLIKFATLKKCISK